MVPTPYLLIIGNYQEQYQEQDQIFLVVDCEIIMEVSLDNCVLILLSSFFVYNICYPKGCKSIYSFLEFVFFDSSVEKLVPSVKQFLANLECHS